MRTLSKILLWIIMLIHTPIYAQEAVSWQRSENPIQSESVIFISSHAINLETAHNNSKGNLEFQIYHRFFPAISEGFESLYGFDGPVNMRLGFGYAVSDNFTVTLGRSNVNDNLDLRSKWQFCNKVYGSIPMMLAVQGGVAWNSNIFGRDNTDSRNFQYYGQLIFNTRILKNLGIGAVPSYLYNSNFLADEYEDTFGFGFYGQYYFNHRMSTILEYGTVLEGYALPYDYYAWGFELQTAGHFFKLFITNSLTLNPSQYIVGAVYPFEPDEFRLGFMVTRLLPI